MAIGLDAVERTFIDPLLAQGRLPNLRSLLEEGKRSDIASVAYIGSGAVWPTFMTGRHPVEHGVSHEWAWDAASMQVSRFTTEGLHPFWEDLASDGIRVGVLDIPYAPLVRLREGFEVSEWGPHDVLVGETEVSPPSAARIVAESPAHAFSKSHALVEDELDVARLEKMAADAVQGVRYRGELFARLIRETDVDLAMVVFPEIHHMGHLLWHTVEQDSDPRARHARPSRAVSPGLPELIAAIDSEIGRLRELTSEYSSMMVFSLHGMKPSNGVPGILGPALRAKGLSQSPSWRTRTWRERAGALFAQVKRRSPQWAKNAYHRRVDQMVQFRLARSTMLEQQDWSRTRAIALPTDQHGLVRLNLEGREREGLIHAADYEVECDLIEKEVRSLHTTTGLPLVDEIVRPKKDLPELRDTPLADLIVHWTTAAHHDDLEIDGVGPDVTRVGLFRTGQHTGNAFCITVGPLSDRMPDMIATEDLHKAIVAGVTDPG